MSTAPQQQTGAGSPRVFVSNTATNMVSSLHPFDKKEADAALEKIRSSVLDPLAVKKVAGVENAFVARVDDLRVLFKHEGDSVVITSIVARD